MEYQWQYIWLVPAGIAAVCFVVFALLFKEGKKEPAVAITEEKKSYV